MSSSNLDDSSRFEELPDEPAPAPTPAGPASARTFPERAGGSQQAPPPAADQAEPLTETEHAGDEDDDHSDGEHDDSVWWTPSELRDIINRSTELKAEGNRLFGRREWENALVTYRDGLSELPVRTKPSAGSLKGKERETEANTEATAVDGAHSEVDEAASGLAGLAVDELATSAVGQAAGGVDEEGEMAEVVELRSILFANVAACLIKLERWKEAVQACDDALEDNPMYTKALQRRAMANESLASWSSLASALEDYNTLAGLALPAPLAATVKSAQRRLPGLIAAQQEREKDEVLGKLKDLGNTVLGKFGLSTDNFKFVEQPGGGYSMNFQR